MARQLASTAATTPITSDWTLDKGYTVELKTLPTAGTDQAAVDSAKQDATSQGAADVGIINTLGVHRHAGAAGEARTSSTRAVQDQRPRPPRRSAS